MEKFIPYLFAFGAVAIFAFITTINRKLATENLDVFAIITITPLFVFLLATALWFFLDEPLEKISHIPPSHWFWLVIISLVNTVSIWLLVTALKDVTAIEYNLINLLAPIFAMIFSYFLLKESSTWHAFVGLIFIAIGLYIALYKPSF